MVVRVGVRVKFGVIKELKWTREEEGSEEKVERIFWHENVSHVVSDWLMCSDDGSRNGWRHLSWSSDDGGTLKKKKEERRAQNIVGGTIITFFLFADVRKKCEGKLVPSN